ncbi:MAG: WD40/YVTN/BNR-like repeat-containing protein [Lysobacterales bacterium]
MAVNSAIGTSATTTGPITNGDFSALALSEGVSLAADAQTRVDHHGWRVSALSATTSSAAAIKQSLTATSASWRGLGPFGGDVGTVAASPIVSGLVLAGMAPAAGTGALYRSIDGGSSWTRVAAPVGAAVYDIEYAPDGGIFLGTAGGLLYSNDQGQSFTQRDLGIGINQLVFDVHLVGGSGQQLWIALPNPLGGQPISLMRSDDGGFVWTNASPPVAAGLGGTAVAVDPLNSNRIVATFSGDFGGGAVWASSDGGQSWVDRSAGLPPGNPVFAVVYDGSRFLVGGGRIFGSQFVGLYATDDLGAHWTPLHNPSWPLRAISDIALDPNQPGVILAASAGAGVYRSADGGLTWQFGIGGTATLTVDAVRFLPGSSSAILIGTELYGVYRSNDSGGSFARSSHGINELNVTSVSANPLNPQELAVAFSGENIGGIFRSLDGGSTWSSEPVPPTRYTAVAHGPDGTLHAISGGPTTIAPEGLYRRQANGSWIGLGPDQGPQFESDLHAIAFDPEQAQTLLLGGSDVLVGNGATIWRSTDGGVNWSKRFNAQASDRIVDLQYGSGGVVLAGYDGFTQGQTGGMLRSTNAGLDWTTANLGLLSYARVPRLCRATNGDFWLKAWSQFMVGAVYRSQDQGTTWQQRSTPGGDIADIACDPGDAQVVYLVRGSAPWVLQTRDAAASYIPWDAGLSNLGRSTALVPAQNNLLLAGPHGIFRSQPLDRTFADGFEQP